MQDTSNTIQNLVDPEQSVSVSDDIDTVEKIKNISSELEKIELDKKLTKIECINLLFKRITVMRKNGYSYEEIVKLLEKNKFYISENTLKNYYNKLRNKKTTVKKKTQSEKVTESEQVTESDIKDIDWDLI